MWRVTWGPVPVDNISTVDKIDAVTLRPLARLPNFRTSSDYGSVESTIAQQHSRDSVLSVVRTSQDHLSVACLSLSLLEKRTTT